MHDLLNLSLEQIRDAWRVMCSASPARAIEDRGEVSFVFSGLPLRILNLAIISGADLSSEALRSSAETALRWAARRQVPWLLLVTHEHLQPGVDAPAVLDDCGLVPAMPLTGMLAQRVAPAERDPDGLRFDVTRDQAGCAALFDVNGLAYGVPLDAAKAALGPEFWRDHFPVLGIADDTPVCCAAVLMVSGYRYVALVATDEAQQRRGYAEAAMRRALQASAEAHGEQPTVLHATEAGRPLYERMGYSTISTHTLFVDKAALAGH